MGSLVACPGCGASAAEAVARDAGMDPCAPVLAAPSADVEASGRSMAASGYSMEASGESMAALTSDELAPRELATPTVHTRTLRSAGVGTVDAHGRILASPLDGDCGDIATFVREPMVFSTYKHLK